MKIKDLANEIICGGAKNKVQDIYILPYVEDFKVYFRKGKKRTFQKSLSLEIGQQLIASFKYLGQMDIGERRKAQLGSLTYLVDQRKIRLRLSSVGDYLQRESLVIRILYALREKSFRCFVPKDLQVIERSTNNRGLFLFSGPVGSGKTSLMYHLARRNEEQVITIEDPVEIEEPLFLQLQVNEKIDQTYDQLLKLALRHRPDLLIVGEIRDKKTADAAIRAALTGHRVFATVHARDLKGTLARMKELTNNDGFDECLSGIVYQELLPDFNEQPTALWSYCFSDNEIERKEWRASYEEAQKNVWQSYPF
ncbi:MULTISPECIES: competence type IV pilus ATPase ComGA [Enterococcus]|uniref:Competence protein ComGA n=1 Tax=Enterococcus mundtii TaxID=53346 RepID=A0ABQ0VF44_ENTMU|nr:MULTISPECIES: competence type IV pilus ATPase ComGA [Enterococcus]GEN19246.1 competence protein ComGA [Ligilactobacillus acidipiscis]AUB53757.1 secretion system protein E [Enterococcus mundtii]MZZ59767.1 secretion system protein E [Enterococcus mundtii]MZZ62922.1 secretion system protein E [Enterococcus mundtii]MZZ69707.1 secretion system protein E [Enterococcus mundtii]